MRGLRLSLLMVLVWQLPAVALACPFCSGSLELTFSQQIEEGVSAVIARQSEARGGNHQATFILLDVLKVSPDLPLNVREPLRVTAYDEGATGELYFIVAGRTADDQILWGPPQPISCECRQYILQRPDYANPRPTRLAFYANYLEHADADVAMDAWTEFASAQFEDIAPISDRLPHERLATIVASQLDGSQQLQSPEWLGLYGMLLGLCGGESDACVMRDLVLAPAISPDMPRLGIDGVMGGLLLLQGEAGLALLEAHITDNPEAPLSEHLAVRNACSFMWSYGGERIPKLELQRVVRRYLLEPQLAAIVLPDLGRWSDWESIELVSVIHDDPAYSDAVTQQQIVQFLLAAERAAAAQADTQSSTALSECLALLDVYLQRHTDLVRGAEAATLR